MSGYNPAPKVGFTKTGKSLKAVRRYYALMNQAKSPKSPEEEKLSKRIAAELKTQQDANEKRSKREMLASVPLMEQSEMNRSMPTAIIISPRDTGPVFISPTVPPPPAAEKSVKSYGNNQNADARSLKSAKSGRDGAGGCGCPAGFNLFKCSWCGISLLNFILGFFLGVMVGAAIYHFAPRSKGTKIFMPTTTLRPRGYPRDMDEYSGTDSPGDEFAF